VIREPGTYAVVDGRELRVTARARDEVWVEEDGQRRPVDRNDDAIQIFDVIVSARWDGEPVDVAGVHGSMVGIRTNSSALAERQGLAGDQYGGWHGETSADELTDIEEQVRPVPRRSS
jgi:hypothetical protein